MLLKALNTCEGMLCRILGQSLVVLKELLVGGSSRHLPSLPVLSPSPRQQRGSVVRLPLWSGRQLKHSRKQWREQCGAVRTALALPRPRLLSRAAALSTSPRPSLPQLYGVCLQRTGAELIALALMIIITTINTTTQFFFFHLL